MKKIFLPVCFVMALVLLLGGCNITAPETDDSNLEMSMQNYRQGHSFEVVGDVIYSLDEYSVFKMDAASGQKLETIDLEIFEETISPRLLYYYDNALYFLSGHNGYIVHKLDLSTYDDEMFYTNYDFAIYSIFILNNKLYYITDSGLCAYDFSTGNSAEIVSDVFPSYISSCITQGRFYFISGENHCLYGCDYDGENVIKYTEDRASLPATEGENLYYLIDGTYYCQNLETGETEPLDLVSGIIWGAFDGSLYFSNYSEKSITITTDLLRYNLSSGEIQTVLDYNVSFAEFADGWIRYYDVDSDTREFVKMNG